MDHPAGPGASMQAVGSAAATPGPVNLFVRLATSVLRTTAVVLIVVTLLPEGSARVVPAAAFAVCAGILAAASILICGEPRRTATVHRLVLALLAIALATAALQAWPLETNPWANPIWDASQDLLGRLPGAVSIHPADTVSATVFIALPFVMFLVLLVLFPDDESALALLRVLGVCGALTAALSLVQFHYFPDALLFADKRWYLDSLTGPFVNRNTGATFFGATSIVLLSLLVVDARAIGGSVIRRFLAPGSRRTGPGIGWRIPLNAASLIVVLMALFLTRSRGGVGGTLIAFMLVVPLFAAFASGEDKPRTGFSVERNDAAAKALRAIIGLFLVLLVAVFFAERAAFRAAVQGTEDARFCVLPGILDLIGSNWPTGTGLGTFRDAFPPFRDAVCGVNGVWDRAHNGYLEALAGLGVVGAALIVIGFSTFFVVFSMGTRNRRSQRAMPLAGFGLLVLLLIHSAVDFSLQIPGMAVWAAALLAPIVTISLGRKPTGRRSRGSAQI